MTLHGRLICEACGQPIEPGEGIVLAQEADGVVMVGLLDSTADGRVAAFHEIHWADRVGNWHERDRGEAK